MIRIEIPRSRNGHYYPPIRISGQPDNVPFVPAFLDTGASKCTIPKPINDASLRLPKVGRDDNIRTATAIRGYDIVRIPKITLLSLEFVTGTNGTTVRFHETDLFEENVETWLGDAFILGMNFISKFDIQLKRNGVLIIERQSDAS